MEFETNKKIDEMFRGYEEDFNYQIRQRGKEYYNKGKVTSVVKSDNTFISKVKGSGSNEYNVLITLNKEDEEDEFDYIDYECDCPYDYSCKHIFATILAIRNKEYSEIELKPIIKKHTKSLQELIEEISPYELKNYLLSEEGKKHVSFDMSNIEKNFSKYLPRQEYDFYYNPLYNNLVVDSNWYDQIAEYLSVVKNLIKSSEYEESFYICKSIVEASNDTDCLNRCDRLIEFFPSLGMNLRIIYRKASPELKDKILKWISSLEEKNFYDNLYLEDVIFTIK